MNRAMNRAMNCAMNLEFTVCQDKEKRQSPRLSGIKSGESIAETCSMESVFAVTKI
jgi:hypothetical protein